MISAIKVRVSDIMEITGIKIRKITERGRLRGIVSVTFDDVLAVHDIKIVQGEHRIFAAMPSRRESDGTYRDVVHPINAQFRSMTENAVLDEYRSAVGEKSS